MDRLGGIGRVDLREVERELHAGLREPAPQTLREGQNADDPALRLFCLRVLEPELTREPAIVERAARDRDPRLCRWLAGRAADGTLELAPPNFEALLRDHSSCVATVLLARLSDESAARHRELLLERTMADARPVRELARYRLARIGEIDLAATCRERVVGAGAEPAPGAIAALSETGEEIDVPTLANLLEHPRPRVRAAAVQGVARLGGERDARRIVRQLADPSGRVRRAALTALERVPAASWTDEAWKLLEGGPEPAQLAAQKTHSKRGGWAAIAPILRPLAQGRSGLDERAWPLLDAWYRVHASRGWLRPSAHDLEHLSQVWPISRRREDAPVSAAESCYRLREWIQEMLGSGGGADAPAGWTG